MNSKQYYLSPTFLVLLFAVLLSGSALGQTQFTANSLAELRTYSSESNAIVTLAAGEYWLEGDGSNPIFLDFSGSNTTFDLSAATIKIDTRDLAGYGNSNSIRPVVVTGDDNLILGLDLAGVDVDLATDPNARRFADRSGVYLQNTGNDNTFQDTTLLILGSSPYGLGDVFGKGARPSTGGEPVEEGGTAWIHHRKMSSFLVTDGATNTIVDNLDLTSKSYGHGFFVQGGATNTTIRNSTITGELISSNTAIANPEYQEYAPGADGILGTADDGGTSRGTPISPNIQLSAQEDGIRMYGGTTGLTVQNVVVTNMRSGVHSTFANGTITIDNVEAYGTENAFVPGSNTTITNSKGDITNGPLVYVQYNGKSNTTIDVELVGGVPVGVDWAAAYLNGNNFDVTISSNLPASALPDDSLVRFGQTWFNNWRDNQKPTGPETADPGPFTNSSFTNNTNQMMTLGKLATSNTGSSQAGVITNGKDNAYDGISVVLAGTRVVLTDASGLGNNGTAADGSLETNASVVFDGATLEIQSGIRITDEKLTITGDGVDGKGALYSDGSNNTNTRFGGTSTSDESTIFLDGDASIGVGNAGNLLLVGRIQGTGDLTKLGAGSMQMSKSSTFDGNLIVEQGHITARPGVVHSGLTVAAGASISGIGNNSFNTADADVFLDGTLDLNSRTDNNTLAGKIGRLHGDGAVVSTNPFAGSGGILEIAGDFAEAEFSGAISTNISLIKSGNSDQWLSGTLTHSGTTTVNGGGLYVNGNHTGGGAYLVDSAGTLGGDGMIDAVVEIGAAGQLAPGSLETPADNTGTLLGSAVVFKDESQLTIEIASDTDFDKLMLSGSMTVESGAVLQLVLLDGFAPTVGDQFNIIVLDTFIGEFDTFSAPILPQGQWDFSLLSSQGIVRVVGGPVVLGDCNLDGVVDFLDISPFIAILSTGAFLEEADCNQDEVVDFLDISPFIAILSGN